MVNVVIQIGTGMSMELSSYLVSWVVAYLGDLQPAYIYIYIKWILWKIDGSYGKNHTLEVRPPFLSPVGNSEFHHDFSSC